MAKYNNPGHDLYDEDLDQPIAAPSKEEGGSDKEEYEGPTALLPKTIAMGKHFDVGDEIVLRITGIHDAEFEVTYASEPKGREDSMEGEHDELYE